MRTVYFKTTDNTFEIFESNNTSIILQEALPFGIEYRHICSCELTQEQIDAWLNEYSDVFGIQQPESVQPSVDEETVRDNQRINNVTSTAQNPSGEQTQHQKVMAAKTKDELDQLLFGQSLGR